VLNLTLVDLPGVTKVRDYHQYVCPNHVPENHHINIVSSSDSIVSMFPPLDPCWYVIRQCSVNMGVPLWLPDRHCNIIYFLLCT
jgi:hypothetical protein